MAARFDEQLKALHETEKQIQKFRTPDGKEFRMNQVRLSAVLAGQCASANVFEITGRSSPLGATVAEGGVNFSVFSRNASGVELLFFDREDDARPVRVIPLDPATNLTYHYWHTFVPGVRPGQIYGYRVQGQFDPANGMRFDAAKILLDPYGRAV